MSCPTCRGRGVTYACLVRWERHGEGLTLRPSYLPARCQCGAGDHAPGLPYVRDLLDQLRGPRGAARWSGLIDVVELEAPWGRAYARALETLLAPGERVEGHHRDMAWRAVQAARAPMTDAEIGRLPRMEVVDRVAEVGW